MQFEWFCKVLAEFSAERQEAFDNAWSEGDVASMTALIDEHTESKNPKSPV